jgi:hypothetical protein
MRRGGWFPILLILSAAVPGCTRSAAGQPPPDVARTAVAGTLAAASAQPPTARFPSLTPPPSATPILTPTATATATATPGASPTATLPPLPAGDPRTGLNLALPDYRDEFGNDLTWVGPSFEGATNEVEAGRLHTVDHRADAYIWWSTTSPEIDSANLFAEVTAVVEACAGRDAYGMAVRVSGYGFNSGYALEFSCDGHYRFRKFLGGTVSVISDWAPSPAIRPGPNSTNRMGFLANGPNLYAVANGQVIGQAQDFDLTAGNFGLFASAEATADLSVSFDDFSLWTIEP